MLRSFLIRYSVFLLISSVTASVKAFPERGSEPIQTFNSGARQVALLELFSSQGCSSCPPAERWISSLVSDERLWSEVVPVVFHVDYWDYLGWTDPYATLKNSQRQRLYQLHGHFKAVYTPGFVLAGVEWREWFHSRILELKSSAEVGSLMVTLEGDQLSARFARNADNRNLVLNVAFLGFDIHTEIARGENQGKRLPQDFVVLTHQAWGSDTGMWKQRLDPIEFEGRLALAIWVSHSSDPMPIQATGGWLSKD